MASETRLKDVGHNNTFQERPHFNSIYNGKKYFSGIDAEIYFNGDEFYIDEIVQIGFQLQQNTMPLFGYNSYIYDELALGSRIINGSFAINFTKANYLYEVVEKFRLASIQAKDRSVKTDESGESYYEEAEVKDQVIEQSRRPVWDDQFSILMAYGDKKAFAPETNETLLQLKGVQLTGCSQQFDSSGEPIIEMYTFIARDIQFMPRLNKDGSIKDAPITEKPEEEYFKFDGAKYSCETRMIIPDSKKSIADEIMKVTGTTPNNLFKETTIGEFLLPLDTSVELSDISNVSIIPKINGKLGISYKTTIETKVNNPIKHIVPDKFKDDINTFGDIFNIGVRVTYKKEGIYTTKDFIVPVKKM